VVALGLRRAQRLPGWTALFPERPFAVAQPLVLGAFVALGVSAVRRFHPAAPLPA
jgi:hypothetical protein